MLLTATDAYAAAEGPFPEQRFHQETTRTVREHRGHKNCRNSRCIRMDTHNTDRHRKAPTHYRKRRFRNADLH